LDSRFCNSLVEGDFGDGLLLRQSLTEGDFWSLRSGCFTLHRGLGSAEAIDYERIEATTYAAGLFVLPSWLSHLEGMDTYYAVRRVSASGKGELGTGALVRLSLDESGQQRSARPNQVSGLEALAEAGGKIRLRWWYMPAGQEAGPDLFAVYGDGGTGEVDYGVAVGTVAYCGAGSYEYVSEAHAGGQARRFSVRSIAADGTDDGNTTCAGAVADDCGGKGFNGIEARVGL